MFSNLRKYWVNDLLGALNVSLVALPLGLGIASAGGIPPISGVISAIVGGVICSIFGSSKLAISGPGNSMIVVLIASLLVLEPYGAQSLSYLFAAFIVSGILMVFLGLLKLGKLGDNFPTMVVMGLLAGIGVIIILKQLKSGFGTDNSFDFSLDFFASAHVPDTIIFLLSLIILIFYELSKNRLIKFIPGPVWVLLFVIPFVLWQNLVTQDLSLFNFTWQKSSSFFVEVPNVFAEAHDFKTILSQFPRPDFGIIDRFEFWQVTISITLVSSLESLMSGKGVEKLDPLERKVNLNWELMTLGFATVVSGFVGGMPVNTVIARSSININSGAKSGWSIFFQSVILLVALLFLTEYLNDIPFGALAGILVITGYKLTKPKVFKDAYKHGWEQFTSLIVSMLATCFFGLISGVVIGLVFNLVLHIILFDGSVLEFFSFLVRPKMTFRSSKNNRVFVQLSGVLNFINIQPLENLLKSMPVQRKITLDFSKLKLVDLSVLEYINDYAKGYAQSGGKIESVGLDAHYTTSQYPHALHYLSRDKKQLTKVVRKTERQQDLAVLAKKHDWKFETPIVWETPELNQFEYFKRHPIEYTSNVISGAFHDLDISWEISDMTFDQGIFIEAKEMHTTEHLIRLPLELPPFILDREFLYDKLKSIVEKSDIDFEEFPEFSSNFVLYSTEEVAVRAFFDETLIDFLLLKDVYHIECIGAKLLIFRNSRLASVDEIIDMVDYSRELCRVLLKK